MKIYKLVIALGMIGGAFNSTFSAYGDNPPVNPYQPDPNPIRQIAGYEYAWGDEFNVDGVVNPDLWQAEEGFIRGNELQNIRLPAFWERINVISFLDVSKYVPEFIRQTGRFQLSGLAGTIRIGLVMVRLI